jgi:phenylpropionate dioxygenase-like ring-hydroxylating dioxygenase large terminal subunit
MSILIPPKNYHSQEIFDEEIENIFKKQWLFGCLTSDIPNENDYYILNLGKFSIIFYNNGSEIIALQNVCSHRFNRIFVDIKGNAPLICKFHSWEFDGCGKVKSNRKLENQDQYSLKRYSCITVGVFVFFHFSTNPLSFDDQVGCFKKELEIITDTLGNKIHEDNIPHNVNWKVLCENVIEISHCKSIHQDSLVKIGYCIEPPEEFVHDKFNSSMLIPPKQDRNRDSRDKFISKNFPRLIDNNKYKHSLFFPNFTIGVYEGLNITIGVIIPLNAKETIYRLLYFNSKIQRDNKTLSNNLLESMKEEVINFATKVFNEDKEIIEQVQKGVEEADHPGMVYDTDKRVIWFMDAYSKMMKYG